MPTVSKLYQRALMRRLIVYPGLQISSLILTATFGLVCALGTIALLKLIESPQAAALHVILCVALFFAGVVLLILNLVFMNRILGPIYRLNKEIEEALIKKHERKIEFKVRKDDSLADFTKNLSLLVEEIQRQPNQADRD
jgi:hypothetical protein